MAGRRSDDDERPGKLPPTDFEREYDLPPPLDPPITRRALLAGAMVTAAAASSFAGSPEFWAIEIADDKLVPDRRVYQVSYGSTALALFREIAFGDSARIKLRTQGIDGPLVSGTPNNQDVVIHGVRLDPNGPEFSLVFEFHQLPNAYLKVFAIGGPFDHPQLPNQHVTARGERATLLISQLYASDLLPAVQPSKCPPVAVVCPSSMGNVLLQQLFDQRIEAHESAKVRIGFRWPAGSATEMPFAWSVFDKSDPLLKYANAAKSILCDLPKDMGEASLRPFSIRGLPTGRGTAQQTTIVRASALEFWHTAASWPQKPGSEDATTPSMRLEAKLANPAVDRTVVLGTHDYKVAGLERRVSVVLENSQLLIPKNSERQCCPEIARYKGRRFEARFALSGDVHFTTRGLAKKGDRAALSEGPMPGCFGDVVLNWSQDADTAQWCRLQFSEPTFELSTSFGPFWAQGPGKGDARPIDIKADKQGIIRAFTITAMIKDAPLVLDERSFGEAWPAGTVTARLDFKTEGTTVRFVLPTENFTGTRSQSGRIVLGYLPPPRTGQTMQSMPGFPLESLLVVPLENAEMRLTRSTDLATMKLRFRGLELVGDGASMRIKPQARAAFASESLQNVPDGAPVRQLLCEREAPSQPASGIPAIGAAAQDQPLLIVELPPQHVAEEAFFHQRKVRPQPPDIPLKLISDLKLEEHYARLRLADTIEQRTAIKKIFSDHVDREFKEFADDFGLPAGNGTPQQAKDWQKIVEYTNCPDPTRLSKLQLIYVGNEFLDSNARVWAEAVAYFRAQSKASITLETVPVDPLSPDEIEQVKLRLNDQAESVKVELERLRSHRDPQYAAFKKDFDNEKFELGGERLAFAGRGELLARLMQAGATDATSAEALKNKIVVWYVKYSEKFQSTETPRRPVQARYSGGSRLVFKVNPEDPETGGEIPLSFDGLTNWSRFELAVVRRAEKLFKRPSDGRYAHASELDEDIELADMLLHQGFKRGGDGKNKKQHSNGTDADEPEPVKREWAGTRVTAEERLAEIVKLTSDAPAEHETSIEMPFRLMLSPSQDALFRTKRLLPDGLDSGRGTAAHPLWTAQLDPGRRTHLRAVWSPDFRPEALLPRAKPTPHWPDARANRPPPRGPYAPWAIGRDAGPGKSDFPHRFRNALDSYDRHELVMLSSVHGLPVTGRVKYDGSSLSSSQREPPAGFYVSLPGERPSDSVTAEMRDLNEIYIPQPLNRSRLELSLSAMGGFLTLDSSFEPPAAITDTEGNALIDSLSLERWQHHIVLGRDISAEVVYKGYLYPLGIRAALIKSTERRFEMIGDRNAPVAVLRQRMFIRIAKPEKTYPAFRQPDSGRRLPFKQIRLLTTATPDLVDATDISGKMSGPVWPCGQIHLPDSSGGVESGMVFWPRTARHNGAEVMFDVLLDERVKVRLPLIFVDNIAATSARTLTQLAAYYNDATLIGNLSTVQTRGAKLAFAPAFEPGDTDFETHRFRLVAEGQRRGLPPPASGYAPSADNIDYTTNAFLQGADQPPFYPAMHDAEIVVAQIDRLTGNAGLPVTVGYDTDYSLNGFQPRSSGTTEERKGEKPREIYLVVYGGRDLSFNDKGDKAGAVARPEMKVVGLSRSQGIVGSQSVNHNAGENALAVKLKDQKIDDIFLSEKATILGVVDLSKFLKEVLQPSEIEAPVLKEVTEYGTSALESTDAFIRLRVIQPLLAALTALDSRIEQLEINGESGAKVFAKLYPDVSAAKASFRDALVSALNASDVAASAERYTAIYASGQRFVKAVERAAEDPVTPMLDALVSPFVDYVRVIEEQYRTFYDKLRELALAQFKTKLIAFVRANVVNPLAGLVIALPPTPMAYLNTLPGDPEKLKEALAQLQAVPGQVASAIDESLVDEAVWLENGQFDPKAFCKKLEAALKARRDAATGVVKAALEEYVEQVKLLAAKEAADIERQLAGPLKKAAGKILQDIVAAAAALQDVNQDAIDAFKDAAQKLAKEIDQGLSILTDLSAMGAGLSAACSQWVTVAHKYLMAVLPPLPQAPASVCTTDCKTWDVVTTDAPYAVASALVRLDIGIHQLIGNNGNNGYLSELANSLPESLGDVKEQVLQAQMRLGDVRTRIAGWQAPIVSALTWRQELESTANRTFDAAIASCSEAGNSIHVLRSMVGWLNELTRKRQKAIGSFTAVVEELQRVLAAVIKIKSNGQSAAPSTDGASTILSDPGTWTWRTAAVPDDPFKRVAVAKSDIAGLVTPVIHTLIEQIKAFSPAAGAFGSNHEELDKLPKDGKAGEAVKQLIESFKKTSAAVHAAQAKLDAWIADVPPTLKSIEELTTDVEKVAKLEQLATNIKALISELFGTESYVLADLTSDTLAFERRLGLILGAATTTADKALQAIASSEAPKSIAIALSALFEQTRELRDKAIDVLPDPATATNEGYKAIFTNARLLLSAPPADGGDPKKDSLAKQAVKLSEIAKSLKREAGAAPPGDGFRDLIRLVASWSDVEANGNLGPMPIAVIFKKLKSEVDAFARGSVSKLIDMDSVRRIVEDELKHLIPTRVTLSYDFGLDLNQDYLEVFYPVHNDVAKSASGKLRDLVTPSSEEGNCRLDLKVRSVIDLKESRAEIKTSGELGSFVIKLIGKFDVASLKFNGARFNSDNGSRIDTKVTKVELGEMVKFIEEFASYFSFSNNGFVMRVMPDLPGIEAGYQMPPATLNLGAVNFLNLSINASCILPFSSGKALFKVGLSRPEAPFAITYGVYGGGGHLSLYATAEEIVGFSASLEFGALVSYRYGPLVGDGRVTAGVYIRSLTVGTQKTSTIEGLYTVAGSGYIGIFRTGAMMQVRVGQQPSGKLAGHAIFTFSFSLGLKDIEYRFVIYKEEGQGFSGGPSGLGSQGAMLLDQPIRYARAGTSQTDASPPESNFWSELAKEPEHCVAKIKTDATCKGEDFNCYLRYFSEEELWMPE